MIALLVLAFLLVPIGELAVIVKVSSSIGVLDTLLLLILVSVVGAWLVKREGLGVWRRINEALARGEAPGRELVDGLLILLAGSFMLTPGFITDAAGLLLLLPPVRAVIRAGLARRFTIRAVSGPGAFTFGAYGGGQVHDSRARPVRRDPDPESGDRPPNGPPPIEE